MSLGAEGSLRSRIREGEEYFEGLRGNELILIGIFEGVQELESFSVLEFPTM